MNSNFFRLESSARPIALIGPQIFELHRKDLAVHHLTQGALFLRIAIWRLDRHEQAGEFRLGGIPKVFGSSATDFV